MSSSHAPAHEPVLSPPGHPVPARSPLGPLSTALVVPAGSMPASTDGPTPAFASAVIALLARRGAGEPPLLSCHIRDGLPAAVLPPSGVKGLFERWLRGITSEGGVPRLVESELPGKGNCFGLRPLPSPPRALARAPAAPSSTTWAAALHASPLRAAPSAPSAAQLSPPAPPADAPTALPPMSLPPPAALSPPPQLVSFRAAVAAALLAAGRPLSPAELHAALPPHLQHAGPFDAAAAAAFEARFLSALAGVDEEGGEAEEVAEATAPPPHPSHTALLQQKPMPHPLTPPQASQGSGGGTKAAPASPPRRSVSQSASSSSSAGGGGSGASASGSSGPPPPGGWPSVRGLPPSVAGAIANPTGQPWDCAPCGHLNFAGRLHCQKCAAPRPALNSTGLRNSRSGGGSGGGSSSGARAASSRLCVSHDGRASVSDLMQWFSPYGIDGPIVDRGRFAFIQFTSAKAATAARAEMGRPLSDGRVLVVLPAHPRS